MKNLFLVVFTSLFFAHVGLSNTYVWEDYDDFSGSSLDTSKWGTMYFYGGDKPVISSGQVIFSSSGKSISASSEFKQGWNSSAFIDYTEEQPGSVLYVKDESIYGIEALITLPSGSPAKTAICLQVGSLNPYGQHIAELMNDTGSGPSFWIHDYVADTGISTSPSNETTFKVSVINDNQKNIFYVNDTKVHELDASNFTPDWFGINTFENNGQAYTVFADNVRVLRQATTTSLDGSVILITSEDPVKETLVFENGVITSTFENPVDDEYNVQSGISYTLDEGSDASYKITLSDGDYYTFDPSTGTGSLTDYENGQIDESGSWNFSFERFDWEDYDDFSSGSLDSSKWTATNSYFLGNDPTFANGRVELTGLTSQHPHDNTFLIVKDLDGIVGVEADIWLPSDAPVDTGVLIGIADAGVPVGYLDLWGDGDNTRMYVYLENSTTDETIDFQRDAELGTIYRVGVIKEGDKTALFLNGEKVAEVTTWQSEDINILFRGVNNGGSSFTAYLDNIRVLRRSQEATEPDPVTVVSDPNGKPVVVQVGDEYNWNDSLDGVTLWAVVDEQDGPPQIGTTTFENGNQLIAFEFLEQFDGSVTFLAPESLSGHKGVAKLEISDSQEIEVSRYYYLNDNQVYVEETSPELYPDYSSSLREYSFERIDNERGSLKIFSESGTNEIILTFSDWESGIWSDYRGTGDWQCYDFTHSDVPTEYQSLIEEHSLGHHQDRQQIVSHPYEIDSNGYLKVTENTSIQYYNVVSVDNGIIGTIQDDSGVDSVADNGVNQVDQWFFTTLSAAQIFYNEKIDYAPESLDGLTVKIHDLETSPGSGDYGEDTKYFVSQQVYSWEENQLESTTFSYVKNSASSATLTIHHDDGATKTIHALTFSSENSATGTWTEAEETVTYTGTTTFTIIDEEYAPDYLNGWKLDAGADIYKFTGDSTGVFYHVDEGNYSNSELSNITYTWEKAGAGIGKLHTSLDEITWLFFEDNTTGRYHLQEQEQDNNGSEYFSLNYYPDGHAHESLAGDSLKLGDTIYVFTSDTSVTVSEGNTSSVLEYAYLKNGSNNGILSLDPKNRYAIMDLKFYSNEYGKVQRGGSGYFRVLQNWATKGWVWQDYYPWAYSNNMQDWFYQTLFINDDKESDMAHYQVWNKQWKIPGELHYSGESDFSSAEAYAWDDYDDFSGTELNSSKWDVAWWDGAQPGNIDNGKLKLSGTGNSYSPAQVNPQGADAVIAKMTAEAGGGDKTPNMHNFAQVISGDIHGISAKIMIPSDAPVETGIGISGFQFNSDGTSHSMGIELGYWFEGGPLELEFENEDPPVGEGTSISKYDYYLGEWVDVSIIHTPQKGYLILNDEVVLEFETSYNPNWYGFFAFNDQDPDWKEYKTYVDNVRVLRKKSYPQGWMWMDYYPWAYHYDTDSWLYFQLAKDTDGQPGMIYWDTATKDWDIYYPSLSPEQAEDQEKATILLNQE